ncbi:hypothetical protein FCOIX_8802 [Fusarium coicis]|nr:hypothetical protein FCOIX_8802 [Fusarium coicis]
MAKSGIICLLGSLALPVVAFRDLDQMPESWCVTYLSTYLVPVSAATSSPAESSLPGIDYSTSLDISVNLNPPSSLSLAPGVTSSVVTTEVETAPSSSTPCPGTPEELRRRALGGFIGSPSELLKGNVPIYFNGEDYKVFGSQQGPVPSGAITRTFFRDGDILRFQSSRIIPNGEASFCQTPSDGVVHITFSSQPAGCIAVQLSAIGFQQCVNGDVTTSAAATSGTQQFTSASSLGPIISILLSFDELPPGVSTLQAEQSSGLISSTEIVEPESSAVQELTSSTADFPASEIGTTAEGASTTAEATTRAAQETTTETSTVENPATTTFTSALDSTTETTTEAATTTTAASEDIVRPASPAQCIRTFEIQCNTFLQKISLTSSGTSEECSQCCFNDPSCVIFTHSGTQCFTTSDPSDNQGPLALQG